MRNLSPVDFEKKLHTSLKVDDLTGLTPDAEFLKKLNQSLTPLRQEQREPSFYRIWLSGIFNGLAAVASGIILFIGLQILPPFLVTATINGTGLIQAKIVSATVDQSILWRQIAMILKN
jgi:hypothetical protein